MKIEKVNNAEKGQTVVLEKKISPKKEAWGIMLIGLALFIGFSLFFIFFYRPFVPWKKIVCSDEDGTCINYEETREVEYIYVMDGIEYSKIFSRNTVPYQSWPFREVQFTIYVNPNNPTDVKPGNRGGAFNIFMHWMFIILGGYMIGLSIYKFHLIKISKEKFK